MFNDVTTLQYVLLAVVGAILGWLAFKKDTEVENRRRAAIEVASVLKAYGLEKTPALLISYAVGDYSGIAYELKAAAKLATGDPKAVMAEFEQAYQKIQAVKLSTPEGRAETEAALAGSKKAAETKAAA